MRPEELQAFLHSVGHRRFVDYLNPSGETAQGAFDRRLSWARVSQHDPATMDEALFLLQNADALRDVLRQELAEDDWIEETAAGGEWAAPTAPKRAASGASNPRVQEFFAASERARSASPTAAPSPPAEDHAPLDSNSYVNWDEDEDEDDVETRIAHISELGVSPAPAAASEPEAQPTVRMPRDHVQNTLSGLDSLSDDGAGSLGGDQLVYVPPEPKGPPPRAYDYEVDAPEPEPEPEPMRVATPLPAPHRDAEVSLDQRATPRRTVRSRTPPPTRNRHYESHHDDEPRTSMNIRATRSGAGGRSRGGRPFVLVAFAVMAMLTVVVGAGVVGVVLLTMVDTDELMADLGFDESYDSVLGPPDAYDPVATAPVPSPSDERDEDSPEPVADDGGPVAAAAIEAPPPAPVVAPAPAAQPVPEPTPAAPKPAPAPVVRPEPKPAPRPQPAPVARPEPKPAPVPAPEPVAARTVPKPEPAVVPQPEPEPAAPTSPPMDFRGLWLGTGAKRGLKLTIRGQNVAQFSGTAELQQNDGNWRTLQISGTIGSDGALSFRSKDGRVAFNGRMAGMRANGRFTTSDSPTPKEWSVINVPQ